MSEEVKDTGSINCGMTFELVFAHTLKQQAGYISTYAKVKQYLAPLDLFYEMYTNERFTWGPCLAVT